MARPLFIEFEDAIYYLLARGNARRRILHDERDCARFVQFLGESAHRFDAAVLCFVFMGNHFHLLAQTHQPNLGRWMHWLLVAYAVYFNRRHRLSGHLFQGRYKSFLVQEGDYLLRLSRYVHLNPVRGISLGRGNPSERRKRLRARLSGAAIEVMPAWARNFRSWTRRWYWGNCAGPSRRNACVIGVLSRKV